VREHQIVNETTAEASTRLLRGSDNLVYVRLRSLLSERGIEVNRSVLATFFPDDTNMEFGVLVTPDRRVYEFDLHHGGGDLRSQAVMAVITDWRDRTEQWDSTPHRRDIEDALRLIDAG
jgi:hypothetical protein